VPYEPDRRTPPIARLRQATRHLSPITRRQPPAATAQSPRQAAHLEDPAGGVVFLGEHLRAFVDVAEQPAAELSLQQINEGRAVIKFEEIEGKAGNLPAQLREEDPASLTVPMAQASLRGVGNRE
jgi:hypothetical protein